MKFYFSYKAFDLKATALTFETAVARTTKCQRTFAFTQP